MPASTNTARVSYGQKGFAAQLVSDVTRTGDPDGLAGWLEGGPEVGAPVGGTADWVEQFAVPTLSVGTYCLPVGGVDEQSPHGEDELYVVTAGRARIATPGSVADVGPGSVIFVPAGEEHRFVDIVEDLTLLVVFGPAYGTAD
jgi:mannose-6-phosphate isomerase-like protein (cupin superfamily)